MQTIQPGVLVSLRTTLEGGAKYYRDNTKADVDGKRTEVQWLTTRVIEDQDEYNEATSVRGKCSNLIRGCCIKTSFGLVCPQAKVEQLAAAIQEAHTQKDEFNARAMHCRVRLAVLQGRIAQDDTEAERAIVGEVQDLIAEMEAGIKSTAQDPEAAVEKIRTAASRAQSVAGMLDERLQESVSNAVKNARSAARAIVARVQKAGEAAATVLADLNTQALENARFAFLDLSEHAPNTAPADRMPAADVQRFADIDDTTGLCAPVPEAIDAPTSPELGDLIGDDDGADLADLIGEDVSPELDTEAA